jgi:hypothetical protein
VTPTHPHTSYTTPHLDSHSISSLSLPLTLLDSLVLILLLLLMTPLPMLLSSPVAMDSSPLPPLSLLLLKKTKEGRGIISLYSGLRQLELFPFLIVFFRILYNGKNKVIYIF